MKYLKIGLPPQLREKGFEHYGDEDRATFTSTLRRIDSVASAPASRLPDQPVSEKDIKALLKLRRNRERFFDAEMFADPAWDILLELYAARLGQRKISVGSLCVAAAVPGTTALRWIAMLQSKGLIERNADPLDGRRFHLSLSNPGLCAMASYFRTVPIGAPMV